MQDLNTFDDILRRFRFQNDSLYALPTNPTPLDELYPTTPCNAHALETSAPSPASNCVYEETQYQMGVDKTRNIEHPGTFRNMKKLKYFFMKK